MFSVVDILSPISWCSLVLLDGCPSRNAARKKIKDDNI